MGFIKEFKEFALKGNVVDLAVGVIIGSAFNSIVSSLIEDVITPLLLKPALDAAHLTKLQDLSAFGGVKYGVFISAVINFIIVAFVMFSIIKGMNAIKRKQDEAEAAAAPPPPPVEPSSTDKLLMEIRDALKK